MKDSCKHKKFKLEKNHYKCIFCGLIISKEKYILLMKARHIEHLFKKK
jgi:hypothetical protein